MISLIILLLLLLLCASIVSCGSIRTGLINDRQWYFRVLTSTFPTAPFLDRLELPAWIRASDTISLAMVAVNPRHSGRCELLLKDGSDGVVKRLMAKRVFKPYRSAVFHGHLDGRNLLPMDSASAWQVQVRSQEDWTHYMETPVDEDGDGGAIKAQLTVQQFNFVLPPAPLTVLTVELQCPRWTRHQFTTNVIPDDLQLPLSVGAVGPATIPPHDLPLGNFDYDPSRQQFHPRLPIINEQLFGVNYDPIYDDSTKRNTHLTGHWDPFSTGPIQLSFHQMRPWLHHAHGTHIWLRQIGDPKFKQLLITVYYDQIPHCNHHDSKIMQCTNEVHELHGRPLYDDTPPVHPTKYIRHAEPTALFDQVSVGSFQHHAEGWVLPWLRMSGARRVRGLVYSIRIWASLNMKVAGRLMRPDARYYWQIEDAVKHDGLLTAWSFTAKALAPRRCMTSPFRVLNLPTAPIIEEDGEDESVPLLTGEDQSLIEESNEPL